MTVIVFITDNDSPRLNWMVYDLYFNRPSAATSLIHLLDQSQPAVVVSWQTRNCGGDRDMTVNVQFLTPSLKMYLSDAGQAQMTYTVFQMYHSLNDVVSKDFHKHFLITFFKTTTADW